MDFSHLGSLAIKSEKTADFTFYDIPGEPVLRCVFAGETNKRYYNEVLRRTEQVMRRKKKLSVELLRDQRDRDRELFPLYVVKGWPNAPLDKDKVPAPYNQENVAAFLAALPDHLMDELRAWAKDASNFGDQMDAEAVAGNSPTV